MAHFENDEDLVTTVNPILDADDLDVEIWDDNTILDRLDESWEKSRVGRLHAQIANTDCHPDHERDKRERNFQPQVREPGEACLQFKFALRLFLLIIQHGDAETNICSDTPIGDLNADWCGAAAEFSSALQMLEHARLVKVADGKLTASSDRIDLNGLMMLRDCCGLSNGMYVDLEEIYLRQEAEAMERDWDYGG